MSKPTPTSHCHANREAPENVAPAHNDLPSTNTFSFLLQPDSEAGIKVKLVDYLVDLPQEQFEALLIDSECEV